jgi:hypothetical protein
MLKHNLPGLVSGTGYLTYFVMLKHNLQVYESPHRGKNHSSTQFTRRRQKTPAGENFWQESKHPLTL